MTVFLVEVRRCLSRRLVWVLVAIALVAIVATGLIVFGSTANDSALANGTYDERFSLTDLWPEDGDPTLAVTAVFLAIGGLLGGASMIGAEWRAGTMGTVLTWEPNRVSLAAAKLAASGVLAWLIAMALQVVLVLALVPAASAHGSMDGVDAGWLGLLAGGVFRIGGLAAMAAVMGGAIAMIGRNTAAAFGAAFAYMMVGENVVRAWKPWLRPWLLGENGAIFVTGRAFEVPFVGRGFAAAALTLAAYAAGLAALAVASFRLRDVSN